MTYEGKHESKCTKHSRKLCADELDPITHSLSSQQNILTKGKRKVRLQHKLVFEWCTNLLRQEKPYMQSEIINPVSQKLFK
jgi:hypothetical protein